MQTQSRQQSRGPASYLGLFMATVVAAVIVRQAAVWLGLTKEPLVWSVVFGLVLGVFLLLFEMALDAWRRRRDDAS
ncbi:hypothetical protein AAEX63_11610 [Luteococcus sp. H138]|uniref:hypothetical protein n=1 Tax=unclassified Luteococcus TaxID=2639923 RepID=UPI00313F1993